MNNYWRKRIEAEMKAREKDDIALSDAMKQLHDYHYRSIEKEIDSFYQRYADKEKIDLTEARKRTSELDVSAYQKKAKELVAKADKLRASGKVVTKADFTHKENAEMSLYNLMMKVNRLELLQYNIDLAMQELAEDEYKLHEKFLHDGFEQEKAFRASIMADTVPNPKAIGDIAKATLNANFKGASWSKSIWDRQDKLRKVVAQEVYQAIVRGQNGLTIARNLRKNFDVNNSYAKRLAITEHARVQMEVAKQSMLKNGFEHYEVLPEPKACDICKPKAGKKYRVDKMLTGETAPPFHPYCRCAVVEVFEDREVVNAATKVYNNGMEKPLKLAERLLDSYSALEPQITNELSLIANRYGGYLDGLDFKLKTKESLARKIVSDSELDGVSLSESAKSINDVLRYTTIFDENTFANDYARMKRDLISSGYRIKKVKNTWLQDGPYKGVNTILSIHGINFEMQYHTQESFDLKNGKLHELYEERRLSTTSVERRAELDREMFRLSKELTIPKGIEGVK